MRDGGSAVTEKKRLPIVDQSSASPAPTRNRPSSEQKHKAGAKSAIRRQSSRLNPSLHATSVSEKRVLGADESKKKRKAVPVVAITQHFGATVPKKMQAVASEERPEDDGHRTIAHSPKKQAASTNAGLKISIPVSTYSRFDLRTLGGRLTADQADTRDTVPTQADHQAFIEAEVRCTP